MFFDFLVNRNFVLYFELYLPKFLSDTGSFICMFV